MEGQIRIEPNKIRQLIDENGFKHCYIAKILSIHPSLLVRKFKGERVFLPEELVAIANLLRIDLTAFYTID